MPLKVKRHKRNKLPSHSNKKKLRRKNCKTPKIHLEMIAKTWNEKQSAKKNLENMGLSYDPNHTVRQAIKHPERQAGSKALNSEVAKMLEKQAKAPRMRKFKFPNAQAIYFTYLIKKYGDDYKAMAKDPKNVYQETWKRIRSRIAQFKKLEQYQKFMKNQK